MSTRTIVEINHDYLEDLMNEPTALAQFLRALGCTEETARKWTPNGVRILGQRHHSGKLTLTVE